MTYESFKEMERKYPGVMLFWKEFCKYILKLKEAGKISVEAYYRFEEPENERVATSRMIQYEGWTENLDAYLCEKGIDAFKINKK